MQIHVHVVCLSGLFSPPQETVEKAKLSKLLIESHYTNMQKDRKERLLRRKNLEQQVPSPRPPRIRIQFHTFLHACAILSPVF